MDLDDIIRNIADNEFIITIMFAGVAFLIRYAMKKHSEEITEMIRDREQEFKTVYAQLQEIKRSLDKHDQWFQTIFNKLMKPFSDRLYRENFKKAEDSNNNGNGKDGDLGAWS